MALAIAVGVAAAYAGSAAAFSDLSSLFDPSESGALLPAVRSNGIVTLVIAFTVFALRAEQRALGADFAPLHSMVEGSEGEWASWRSQLFEPARAPRAVATAAGAATGIAVIVLSRAFGSGSGATHQWAGHLVWAVALNAVLFALLARLAVASLVRARVLSQMGRQARVRLVDPSELTPFARAGLRGAVYWFLGSSIASLLMLDSGAPWIVAVVVSATIGLGFASLLRPNLGVHERLRAAKSAELSWVRNQIELARGALAHPAPGDEALTARLPALLAYETRIQAVREWPFDTSTRVRFLLFLLVPVGSWLGGALIERAVDLLLG